MHYYNLEERRKILEIYLNCNKNMTASKAEFIRRYPNQAPPAKMTFKEIYNKFCENDSLKNKTRKRRKTVLDEEMQINILLSFIEEPNRSTYSVAEELNVSQKSVMRTLKINKFKPFHLTPVQELNENDCRQRILFCQQIIERYNENNDLLHNIFWTDESSFSTAGIFNRHNTHHWATENPRMLKKLKKQGRKTVNVWCGIHRNKIIGPIFINTNLTGAVYLNLLQQEVEEYLDNLPVLLNLRTIWQQDGAPPHNIRPVTNHLNQKYAVWIGKNGPIHWPAKSPDLNPLDFYLWGALKNNIYSGQLSGDTEQLKQLIREAIHLFNADEAVFEKVRSNFLRRCFKCIENNGSYIENTM